MALAAEAAKSGGEISKKQGPGTFPTEPGALGGRWSFPLLPLVVPCASMSVQPELGGHCPSMKGS